MPGQSRFRFSLKFLLGGLFLTCLFAAWMARRIPHCRAVAELQRIAADVTWMRNEPTWLDEQLGAWRLDRVKSVYYVGGTVQDFAMLEDLNYLEEFSTFECLEIDYRPLLKHAKTMRGLGLDPFPKEPEKFFANFPHLEYLLVRRDLDLSQLSHLTKLKRLSYYNWANSDFEDLPAFENLVIADLRGTKIRSTKPLSKLKQLEELYLDSCVELVDISGIDQLPKLRELSLDGCNQIQDLSPISNCLKLESLTLPYAGELTLPTHLLELKELSPMLSLLEPNHVDELRHFTKLERLSIDWSGWREFDGIELDLKLLKDMKDLSYLCACRITDSNDLSLFPKLKTLILQESTIKSSDSILAMDRLELVILRNCEIPDQVVRDLQIKSRTPNGFDFSWSR